MTDTVQPTSAGPVRPGLADLFLSFVIVALSGFGAALPWARRMIVDRKGWMSTEEFNEAFALAQFLPGPNVVNFAVVFGSRFGGAAGAVVAFAGLMGPPLIIVTVLAVLYAQFGELEILGRILSGVTAAAAGMLIAVTAKMATPLWTKAPIWPIAIAVMAFAGVAIMRWPLPYVFAVLAPVAIGCAWFLPAKVTANKSDKR